MAVAVPNSLSAPVIMSSPRSGVSTHNSRSYNVVRQGDDCGIGDFWICILFFVSVMVLWVIMIAQHQKPDS